MVALAPRGAGVEEIPVFQGQAHPLTVGEALTEEMQAAGIAVRQPAHLIAVELGVRVEGHDDVVENRPAADPGKLLHKAVVSVAINVCGKVSGLLGDLDEPLITLAHDLTHGQHVFVRHDVRGHGCAVVVGLL